MAKYEIMYLIDPGLEDFNPLKTKIENLIAGDRGKITQTINLGLRDLAYPIKKSNKANYFLLMVETSADDLEKFKKYASITKPILRYLILNTELQKNYQETLKLSASEIDEESFKRPVPYYIRKMQMKAELEKTSAEQPAAATTPSPSSEGK